MGKIYKSITELVGHTPLVELTNYEAKHELKATLLGKLEYFNPSGSVKDRAALSMIEEAERTGKLKPGQTIVDNTSGNTGIALAAFGHAKGHEFVTFLEPGVSKEREDIFKAYGVDQYWFTDISPRVKEACETGALNITVLEEDVQAYADKNGYYYIDQCSNEFNTEAHYQTTGPEIWEDTDGTVDVFVGGVGTGGSTHGISKYLKEQNQNIKTIVVQPDPESIANSAVEGASDGGFHGIHQVHDENGLTAMSPENFNEHVIDEYEFITYGETLKAIHLLAKYEGIFVGASAGASLAIAIKEARKAENEGKIIVPLLPDNGERYLSEDIQQVKHELEDGVTL